MKKILSATILGLSLAAFAPPASAQNQPNRERRGDVQNNNNYANWEHRKTSLDKLPGPVKAAFGKEAGPDKLENVTELVSKDGKKVYQAEIVKAEGARGRVIRVDDSGNVMKEINTTERGRERVDYDTLPGQVKGTISKATNGKQPGEVTQVTRGGDTFYAFQHDGKTMYVGKNGKLLSESELPK